MSLTLHIVPHTHWDREWYLPFQVFRIRLVHLMDRLLDILGSDVHAPLYFLLLKAWSALFGQSEYALRSLGATISLLCIPALFWLARPALGALWAYVPVAVTLCLMVVRTHLEDRTLHRELDGYREYAAQVRYRLLPGIW